MNYLGLEIFFQAFFCCLFTLDKNNKFCIFKTIKFIINSNFKHYEVVIMFFDVDCQFDFL